MINIAEQYYEKFGATQKAMAADMGGLKICQEIVLKNNLITILDCGSGLSTAFFNAIHDNVTTIDDDVFWARQTENFVFSTSGKKISVKSINEVVNQKFDFIFYDFGDMETRIYYLKLMLHMAQKFIYLDDMHIGYYNLYLRSILDKRYKLEILDDKVDEFGRFGAILERLHH